MNLRARRTCIQARIAAGLRRGLAVRGRPAPAGSGRQAPAAGGSAAHTSGVLARTAARGLQKGRRLGRVSESSVPEGPHLLILQFGFSFRRSHFEFNHTGVNGSRGDITIVFAQGPLRGSGRHPHAEATAGMHRRRSRRSGSGGRCADRPSAPARRGAAHVPPITEEQWG